MYELEMIQLIKKINKKDSQFGQYKVLDRIVYKIFHF